MRRKLMLTIFISLLFTSLYGKSSYDPHHKFIKISKKMIKGRVFYSRFQGNSFYILTRFKRYNSAKSYGEVDYVMMDTPKSISGSYEVVYYSLKNGKIVINGNDGSSTRLTLISADSDRWVLLQEEDMDGNERHFGYRKTGKEIWYLKKPRGYPPLERCKPFEMECVVK